MEPRSEGPVGLSVFQVRQIMGLCIANATTFSHLAAMPINFHYVLVLFVSRD
jgi:hypothetical protein